MNNTEIIGVIGLCFAIAIIGLRIFVYLCGDIDRTKYLKEYGEGKINRKEAKKK